MPVRKAWVKKNPEIQKATGDPFSIHMSIMFRGFKDPKLTFFQTSGTLPSRQEFPTASSSAEKTTSPSTAFWRSRIVDATLMKSLLNRISSWSKTTFRESSYFGGNLRKTASKSYGSF